MGGFFARCRTSINKCLDNNFVNNIGNIVLLTVALLLVIALMVQPTVLIALALFGLFVWAIIYC